MLFRTCRRVDDCVARSHASEYHSHWRQPSCLTAKETGIQHDCAESEGVAAPTFSISGYINNRKPKRPLFEEATTCLGTTDFLI